MHGCRAFLVNAEVDSMGGVIEGGVGVSSKASPQQAAIEKAQAKLRQEFDVREERRRELEFLEKGGNPLDFKLANLFSASVHSTSLTDQHPEVFVNSEAKGSFALTASPRGDSVESSGRPGLPPVCEPNSADNLMLFDGENDIVEGQQNSLHFNRTKIAVSEQSSPLPMNQSAKELGEFASFGLPKKAYRRRNRSRPNRDGARSSSTDVVPSHGGQDSHSAACHGLRDTKTGLSTVEIQKDPKAFSNCNLTHTGSSDSMPPKDLPSDSILYTDLEGGRALESACVPVKSNMKFFFSDANAQNKQLSQCSQPDAPEIPTQVAFEEPSTGAKEQIGLDGIASPPFDNIEVENKAVSGQTNGIGGEKGVRNGMQSYGKIANAPSTMNSESSCTHASLCVDGNNESEMCTNLKRIEMNGNAKEQNLVSEAIQNTVCDAVAKVVNGNKPEDNVTFTSNNGTCSCQSQSGTGSICKGHEESNNNGFGLENEEKDLMTSDTMKLDGITMFGTDMKPTDVSHYSSQTENTSNGRLQDSKDTSIQENLESILSVRDTTAVIQPQVSSGVLLKLASKKEEDSIFEEARIIEDKRKRIAELSIGISPAETCQKSQWDFVLEEMAWLANDFSQERIWKITASVHISHQVALSCRLRTEKQNSDRKQRQLGHILVEAVRKFWHSVEQKSEELELQISGKDSVVGVQGYAIRFLKQNGSGVHHVQVEPPGTPDRISEENLFYTVPLGSMESYRKSIEAHLIQCEKTGSSLQEEVETSAYDGVTEFGSQDNTYEEDDGETSTYYLPGAFEGSRSSNFAQKKHKKMTKEYGARVYEPVGDLPYVQCMENKVGTQQSVMTGKRPASSLNVLIPTKRVRTASRPRLLCPSGSGTPGYIQVPTKTEASSGDTNSFQDDQSTLHGGSQILSGLEVESTGEFEKQAPFNFGEVSKPKKKKKEKHMVSSYTQRWQLDSNFQNEQRDQSKKRLENHQLESNGSSGLFGQHVMKKPKLIRQSLDNSFDNVGQIPGSIPSPVASQMSNMSYPSKTIKILGRDRGRKTKSHKMHAGQTGSGSPWSIFEDQALVVLVHDMGPNWELVSDVINSFLQLKCIFRKPKECKDRHKNLIDRTASDGADSAEDSGSSQPYPSTLPGIPKGSARQLFQRLQGPMEEETLKSHFEKIVMLCQKHHCQKAQHDSKDPKQLQQPHSSHKLALSQVSPNNLNGGPTLTPLDLCDTNVSSPDVLSLGYHGPHTGGLSINQGTVGPLLPGTTSANALGQGSSMIVGNNCPGPTGPLNTSVRDGRHMYSRPASLSIEEQQRMQQYNQIFSGRSIQQSNIPVSGAFPGNERGVRMLHANSGVGVAAGLNRSVPMPRPGFQGISSSSVLNSGSMLSSGMVAMPSPVNVHPGVGSNQGNAMMRPRDALQMTRLGQNPESQRQMMASELPMQGNSQAVPPFGALTASLSSPTAPAVQSYPVHHQQPRPMSPHRSHLPGNAHLQGSNHVTNTQQQAYPSRAPKERQLQQRLLQSQHPQQQQFTTSNTLMPASQTQSQLPLSSPLQSNSQTASPVSLTPLTPSSSTNPMFQHQQKHQMPSHGLGRHMQAVGSGLNNQIGKQRQHLSQQQQFQHAGRQHPQPRQQSQSHQPAKLLKGVMRGSAMMHQNVSMDPSLLNGFSATPGRQSPEKSEQVMHMMQGRGMNPAPQSNTLVSPHSSNQMVPQQKIYSCQTPPSSNQGVPSVSSGPLLPNSHQGGVLPQVVAAPSHQQMQSQSHQSSINHVQPVVRRISQQARLVNSDLPSKLQEVDVQADKHTANNLAQMNSTKALPQACTDSPSAMPASNPCTRWKDFESLHDSTTNSAVHSSRTTSTRNSIGIESAPKVSHVLDQILSPGCSASIGHEIGVQRHQQPSQLTQTSTLQNPPSPHQLPPQQQSQQQAQLFQAGKSELYVMPPNSRLE